MRLHSRWAMGLTLAAAAAAAAPSLLLGLVLLSGIIGAATVLCPPGVGRRLFPVAVAAVALTTVEWIRARGLPGL